MNRRQKITAAIVSPLVAAAVLAGCSSEADVASNNISERSERFEVPRRIVAINGFDSSFLFEITGRCSMEYPDDRTEITCKLPDGTLNKHVIRKSDNVTVLMEQTDGVAVSTDQYTVVFNPKQILPNVAAR